MQAQHFQGSCPQEVWPRMGPILRGLPESLLSPEHILRLPKAGRQLLTPQVKAL